MFRLCLSSNSVRSEMTEAPTPPQPEPGLAAADLEEAIRKAIADMPEPDSGLSKSEITSGRTCSQPRRRASATRAYYNSPDSVDAQWYVFIATPEGEILGHYNAEDFAAHLQEMLGDGSFRATEQGVWVNHQDVNPATGQVEDKHFRLVEHDGLVFGSEWHHDESGR